jgi:membrane protease YdiL (CAAX protease family)
MSAALGAVVVLTASLIVAKLLVDWLVAFAWPIAVYVALLSLVGYGPSLVWCRYVSRRWGTGAMWRDLGARPRVEDIGWGPVVWLAAVGCQIVAGLAVQALGIPLSSNTEGIGELSADRTYVIAIVVAAVVAAPVVEELVFRGVVLRGLCSRLPAVAAIAGQGLLFGVAHADPVRGVGNIGLAIVLGAVGVALGTAAYLLRRLAASMIAHGILNAVVLAIVLSGVADTLRDQARI